VTNLTVDATINLAHADLRHVPKAGCKCDKGENHPVAAVIDLQDVLEFARKDGYTAEFFPEPWEKALQQLHEQAHPDGAIYASQCRETGCSEFYNPIIT
jgi:hypothetical protein